MVNQIQLIAVFVKILKKQYIIFLVIAHMLCIYGTLGKKLRRIRRICAEYTENAVYLRKKYVVRKKRHQKKRRIRRIYAKNAEYTQAIIS